MTRADYLTAKELAEVLPFSLRNIAERITHRKDFPPPYRVGCKRFWSKEEVQKWIESRKEH